MGAGCPSETFSSGGESSRLVTHMTLPHFLSSQSISRLFSVLTLLGLLAATGVADTQGLPPKSSGIVANPASVDFGSVRVGQQSTKTETLTNTASTGLTVYSSNFTGAGFSASGLTVPLFIAAGESFTFNLVFAPQASGAVSGNLTLSSRNGRSKLIINLTGTGTSAGTLAVSPTSLNFGNVTVGTSKSMSGKLTASGASVTVNSASVNTSEYKITGITLPLTITAGSSANFSVTFTPQDSGTANDTASFASDASNTPTTESLTGVGNAAPPHVVDLSWDASTSPDIVGYNVYRGTKSGGPYTKINSALDPVTTYDDPTVAAGQTYYYVTTAVDGSDIESDYSNQVKAVIPTP